LLTTLLFSSFLLAGCNNTVEEPEVIDDCLIEENCISEVDNPVIEEPEINTNEEEGKSIILVFSPT
jgi:hypothetical protein